MAVAGSAGTIDLWAKNGAITEDSVFQAMTDGSNISLLAEQTCCSACWMQGSLGTAPAAC